MYRSLRYTTALISSHQTHSEELVMTLSFHLPSKTAQKPNVKLCVAHVVQSTKLTRSIDLGFIQSGEKGH